MKKSVRRLDKKHDLEISGNILKKDANSKHSCPDITATSMSALKRSRKENRNNDNQHNKRVPFGHTFDAAQNQEKIEDQPNNFVKSTNSVLNELRNRNIQRVVSSNKEKQNKDQNPTEPDKTSRLDQPGVSDIFKHQGSSDHDISKENQKSLVSSHQITKPTRSSIQRL